MSTMLSFANNNLATEFMTKEQIAAVCPMALCQAPTNPRVSERYVFANTEMVIDDLAKCGWYPVDAKQCRPRKCENMGVRSFHMLAFQNPNVSITKIDASGNEVVDCYPRIILTNSHDGFSSFRFRVGLFRVVCSNGLVIATDEMADIYVRHVNYTFDELRVVITTAMAQVNEQTRVMNDMTNILLTDEQKAQLAIAAVRIRKNTPDDKDLFVSEDTIADLLQPIRQEDEGDTLWNVFNVVQEHIMRGQYYSQANEKKRPRKARALTSVATSLNFNTAFFRAAYKYATAEDAVVVE